MHAGIIKNQDLVWLKVVQVVLQKFTDMLAGDWSFDDLCGFKTANGNCSQQCNVLAAAGREEYFGLFSFWRPAIVSCSLQSKNGLI